MGLWLRSKVGSVAFSNVNVDSGLFLGILEKTEYYRLMSHWSIEEHSASRLVAKSIPHQPPHSWTNRILKTLVATAAFGPGLVALINGSAILPNTLNCTANGKEAEVMDCRQSWKLGNVEVRSERFQLVGLSDKKLERQGPGNTGFFIFGLLWVAGTTASLVAIRLTGPQKTNWVFDRTTATIQKKPLTLIQRPPRTFANSDVHGLVLEVPDIALDSYRTSIFVRLNLHEGETPTQYLLWNENQPAVYSAPHGELSEVVSNVLQPICQILERPWQLKFFHQDECFIFDFVEQAVDRYLNGERLSHIDFREVADFRVEEPTAEPGETLLYLEPEKVRYLNIVLNNGESFRIHQYSGFDAENAPGWLDCLIGVLQSQIKIPIAMSYV
jgi:hypothetical protein